MTLHKLDVSKDFTWKDQFTASHQTSISAKALYQTLQTTNPNFEKLISWQVFKTAIAIRFYLLHICASVPPFVYAVFSYLSYCFEALILFFTYLVSSVGAARMVSSIRSQETIGTLRSADGDGRESVAEKVNSPSFNLHRDYSKLLTLSNVA